MTSKSSYYLFSDISSVVRKKETVMDNAFRARVKVLSWITPDHLEIDRSIRNS